MRCDRARERLQEYMEGVLTGKNLLAVEEHLRSCPDCRRELDNLRELDAHLRQEVPKYWESIQPSPEFMARLKRIETELSPAPAFKPFEGLSTVWGKHRMALAAGLAVCLVILLALSVPRFLSSDDDNSEMISRNLTQGESATSAADQMLMNKGMTGEAAPAGTPGPQAGIDNMATQSPSVMVSGSGYATPTATLPPGVAPVPTPADQTKAEEIALADFDVKEALHNQGVASIVLFSVTGFDCTGTTVVLERQKADPQQTPLYIVACVDLAENRVVKLLLFPNTPPPITPTSPPLSPEPSLQVTE